MRTASRSVVTAATSNERPGVAVANGDSERRACAVGWACSTIQGGIVLEWRIV